MKYNEKTQTYEVYFSDLSDKTQNFILKEKIKKTQKKYILKDLENEED